MPTTKPLPLLLLLSCCALLSAVDSKSDGSLEWHILTKQNFSSQIRLHPHILLLVTLPWSGESRSLMRDMARLKNEAEELSSLKLMVLHRNQEKVLAKAVSGEDEEISVLYYHHSVSYKYRGRLRARNILHSIRPYVVGHVHEELPLKRLSSVVDVNELLDSTDKALLLFEFCGWSPLLLAKPNTNGTDHNGFGEFFGLGINAETNRSGWWKNNQKGMGTATMKSNIDNELGGVPWIGDFRSGNDSAAPMETENIRPDVVSFCTHEQYSLFDSFFSKFMTVAREFFLPSERHKFGLISDRSVLSALSIEDSNPWLAVLYVAGCPSCLKIIKKEGDLINALQMDNAVIKELEGDNILEPALPANQPSVLLFVDRSSDLSDTRTKGKGALDAFRELALYYHLSHQTGIQIMDKHDKPLVQDYQALRSTSGHPKVKFSQIDQMSKLKGERSSFRIVNEGKQFTVEKIALDLKGNSLQDILEIVLKQKKQAKLSSLAKELGFQLLSDDMDIKSANALSSKTETESDSLTKDLSKESHATSSVDSDSNQLPDAAIISTPQHPENSEVMDAETFPNEEKTVNVDTSNELLSVDSKQHLGQDKLIGEHLTVEEESHSQGKKSDEQQFNFQAFKGSFFFSDGNYRLLGALTGKSRIPSLVIVDPSMQQHYVLPEEANLTYSSIAGFLSAFHNGSLLPYQKSGIDLKRSRKATQPPFVNLDFHQVESIPQVTTHTFSELVIGSNQSDSDAWNKDVLVLLSNRWCGFCQRMELVVYEVYRAMKSYMKTLTSETENDKTMFHAGDLKLPIIYLLDCTLNDCSLILKSMNQMEVYPTLMLFPAEKKHALPYEGDMAVTEIFKFMADHGSNSHHLISEKGILWTVTKKGAGNQNFFRVQTSDKVILTNVHKPIVEDELVKSHITQGLHQAGLNVGVGCVLVATDKLLAVHPFDKSEILIVKADQVSGFQGLIINKHIRWDALPELGEGLDMLAEAPLSFGGPLIKAGMSLVALTRKFVKDEYPEVLPGVVFLNQSATVDKIKELKLGNQSVTDYWFFFGYSSWGWDQLFYEIVRGAWTLSDDGTKHLDWPSN